MNLQQHHLFGCSIITYSFTEELNSKRKLARRPYMIQTADYENVFIDVLQTVLAACESQDFQRNRSDRTLIRKLVETCVSKIWYRSKIENF